MIEEVIEFPAELQTAMLSANREVLKHRQIVVRKTRAAELDVGKVLLADFIRRAFTVSGVRVASFRRSRAAAPLTIGAAMLVPLNVKYVEEVCELLVAL